MCKWLYFHIESLIVLIQPFASWHQHFQTTVCVYVQIWFLVLSATCIFFFNAVAKLSVVHTSIYIALSRLWFLIFFCDMLILLSYINNKFKLWWFDIRLKWNVPLTYWAISCLAMLLAIADCRFITWRMPLILASLWSSWLGIFSSRHGDRSASSSEWSILARLPWLSIGLANTWCTTNISKHTTTTRQSLASITDKKIKREKRSI